MWKTGVLESRHGSFTGSLREFARARPVLEKCEAKSALITGITQELLKYATKRGKARRNPERYCYLIADGAAQPAHGRLHLIYNQAAMREERLKIRLISTKEHLQIPNYLLMFDELKN